ncbi:hypothetical protein Bca4012_012679 [Brassica carinata]
MIDMEIRDDYKFLRVQDAFKALHLNISLIGVIVELDFPTSSDCSSTLKIIDPWHSGSGLPVKFIARTNRTLPRVESVGDIIFLSRVKIVLVNRKITALCNETTSSFALFNGKHGEVVVPYQSSPKFRMREQDKSFLLNLREWMITYKFDDGSCCFTSLKDIREGEYLNLNCQIVHISKDDKNRCYIFVWDGTEMPPCSFVVKSERLPLCVEPEMLPTHVLRMFPTFGSVLRIIVDNVAEKQAIQCLQPCQHVKFLNLFIQVNMGLWSATFSPSTKMQYTMSRQTQPFTPQREKFSSRWNPITRCISSPCHSGITGFDHTWRNVENYVGNLFLGVAREDAPFVSLMNILTYPNDKFFGCDPSDEEALIKRLNKLLGGDGMNEAPSNPPWVQCCLFSYYRDKNDQWGSRRFRIFDTWINGSHDINYC